jgi:D-beta-D-heptose 7-phosphate kinase/D-beta-D-heptose 1-phosphate adenosyltransferase
LKTDILLTRGNKGASYINKSKVIHFNIENKDVVDVTGAGDTSLSTFALMDFLGKSKEESLHYMNKAAKLTVSNLGTYAPKLELIMEKKSL